MSRLRFAGKGDAYLEWAAATRFAFLAKPAHRHDGQLLETEGAGQLDLLVRWTAGATSEDLIATVKAKCGAHIAEVYRGRRICAFTIDRDRLGTLLKDLGGRIDAIEFASPLVSRLVATRLQPLKADTVAHRVSSTEVLLGLLDDGCPFANSRFMNAAGTRVLWLWDQDNARSARRSAAAPDGPTSRVNFGYGHQWSKEELDGVITDAGSHEIGAYRALGLTSLMRGATHGAHVMDLLAGSAPDGSGSALPIVFVQFPRDSIEDPTGRWLSRYTLDGLHHIVQCAGKETRHIVVNVSWGPQTGPHDGTSLLEEAIDELIESQPADGRTLSVAFPAGNTFRMRAHGSLDGAAGGTGLQWVVPPAGETPAFLKLWWPPGVRTDSVQLTVEAPDGTSLRIGGPGTRDAAGFHPQRAGHWSVTIINAPRNTARDAPDSGAMALLAVAPTGGLGSTTNRGPHGTWKIAIAKLPAGKHGEIHLYAARADHAMGGHRRAVANYLNDGFCDAARFGQPAKRDDEAAHSVIRRAGSLNGASTGKHVWVAGGYVGGGRRPGATRAVAFKAAPYSSSGPTQQQQRMPSASYMTDQSPALPGIRATGVRSGTRVRLVGTSMASPQLARDLATPKVPPPHTLVGPRPVSEKVTKPQVPRLGATTETTVEDFLPRA